MRVRRGGGVQDAGLDGAGEGGALVCSSRPLPQAPCTGVADASRVRSTAALSPGDEPPPEPEPWAPWVSVDDGSSSTVIQPDPVVVTSGPA